MVELFADFTTTFFFLVGLVLIGIIFEKQFIALEDKFDEWVDSKRKEYKKNNRQHHTSVKSNTVSKPAKTKENNYRGFAA